MTVTVGTSNEAPWLVNGGHGASFRHHNARESRCAGTAEDVSQFIPRPASLAAARRSECGCLRMMRRARNLLATAPQ
jgi:hypothetical protein